MSRFRFLKFPCSALCVLLLLTNSCSKQTNAGGLNQLNAYLGAVPDGPLDGVAAYCEKAGDLNYVSFWAVLDISLKGAENYMNKLEVAKVPENSWVDIEPPPNKKLTEWDLPKGMKQDVSVQWLRQDVGNGENAVAYFMAVWSDGKMHLYYAGYPLQMHKSK